MCRALVGSQTWLRYGRQVLAVICPRCRLSWNQCRKKKAKGSHQHWVFWLYSNKKRGGIHIVPRFPHKFHSSAMKKRVIIPARWLQRLRPSAPSHYLEWAIKNNAKVKAYTVQIGCGLENRDSFAKKKERWTQKRALPITR